MTTQTHLTRQIVPENHRLAITRRLFGGHFPTSLEPLIYNFTDNLAKDYHGGYWAFYTLSNGGYYMAPYSDSTFHVICDNTFGGDLSADALGITVCLYAYSHLSFAGVPELADICNEQYHLLREYVFEHPEVRGILAATDCEAVSGENLHLTRRIRRPGTGVIPLKPLQYKGWRRVGGFGE